MAKKKAAAAERNEEGLIFNGSEWINPEAHQEAADQFHKEHYYNGSDWVKIPAGFRYDLEAGLIED